MDRTEEGDGLLREDNKETSANSEYMPSLLLYVEEWKDRRKYLYNSLESDTHTPLGRAPSHERRCHGPQDLG